MFNFFVNATPALEGKGGLSRTFVDGRLRFDQAAETIPDDIDQRL
jgi:hypothetical protein